MTGEDNRIVAITRCNESDPNEEDAATRSLAVFLMVLFTVLLGVLTWFSNEVGTTHASSDSTPAAELVASPDTWQSAPAPLSPGSEPEEHIQAF